MIGANGKGESQDDRRKSIIGAFRYLKKWSDLGNKEHGLKTKRYTRVSVLGVRVQPEAGE